MSEHVDLQQEHLSVEHEVEEVGGVRARKWVDEQAVTTVTSRGTEHAETSRVEADDDDDGQVHVFEDGSVSVPVFEEQLVITKRLVVRERALLRKHTVYEDHEVSADLRREHLTIDADAAIAGLVHDDRDAS
jgi:uncharacterized protein (TIGR02271 family)